MTKQFQVRLLPDHTDIPVQDACVVMTDVLRASSTIITALENGAASVHPLAGIEESHEFAQSLGSTARIGGERNGVIVDGFDMGNSPLEYRRSAIGGRPVVLCTTNGTWALNYCRGAAAVLIGSMINLPAVADFASQYERVVVVCAGTDRKITGEDTLFAGGLAAFLKRQFPALALDRNGCLAWALWRDLDRYPQSRYSMSDFFKTSLGGRNLMRLKYEMDIEYCANLGTSSVVPILDQSEWAIGLVSN